MPGNVTMPLNKTEGKGRGTKYICAIGTSIVYSYLDSSGITDVRFACM